MPLGLALVGLGLSTGGLGTVIGLAAGTKVSAATTLGVCGSTVPVIPGSNGSCQETFPSPYGTQPVAVSLGISSISDSGGGQPGSGVATEAPLDGNITGLQVQVVDDSTGKVFLVGKVNCYTNAQQNAIASYPEAAYCTSDQSNMFVMTAKSVGSHTQVFTVRWLLPLQAGNPYQGGGAGVTVQPTFTDLGAGAGAVLGQGTTAPNPSTGGGGGQHQKVLGAQTPSTGADFPVLLSRTLIVAGLIVLICGTWTWRRHRVGAADLS